MEPFYVKKVFVWVLAYVWDEIEHILCPHCGGRAQPDGWNYEARRVYLEEDVCYMIGFRCDCLTDATAVDILETFEVFTCPIMVDIAAVGLRLLVRIIPGMYSSSLCAFSKVH